MLGPEFKEAYRKRAVDPFDEQGWDGKHWALNILWTPQANELRLQLNKANDSCHWFSWETIQNM